MGDGVVLTERAGHIAVEAAERQDISAGPPAVERFFFDWVYGD